MELRFDLVGASWGAVDYERHGAVEGRRERYLAVQTCCDARYNLAHPFTGHPEFISYHLERRPTKAVQSVIAGCHSSVFVIANKPDQLCFQTEVPKLVDKLKQVAQPLDCLSFGVRVWRLSEQTLGQLSRIMSF